MDAESPRRRSTRYDVPEPIMFILIALAGVLILGLCVLKVSLPEATTTVVCAH